MPLNKKLSRSAMPFVLAVIITCVTTAAAITRAMADTGSPAERFAALVADFDAHERAHDPITAGRRGDLEALARWPDGSPEAVAGRLEAEVWLSRLQGIPALFDGHRAWLAQGADTGFVQPRAVVEEVLTQLDAIATTDPETSELVAPLRRLPSAIDASQREQLADTADRLLLERVLPAYRELATWLREVYLASPRESLGISEVPDGRDYYRAVVRHHTTLPLTPEDIHQRGLEEVARIRSEMDEVIERTGFEGTFPQFLEYLRTEMWRACRLVVDTGLHYFGWTREQAEACLLENSALAPHNVRTEVSRYISWPGQALAYKLGELLIRELRAEAETTLGEAFDLRAFHDHILAEGAMPLAALERRMRRWIEAQLAGAGARL